MASQGSWGAGVGGPERTRAITGISRTIPTEEEPSEAPCRSKEEHVFAAGVWSLPYPATDRADDAPLHVNVRS